MSKRMVVACSLVFVVLLLLFTGCATSLTAKAEKCDALSQYLRGLEFSKTGDKQDRIKAYMWLHAAVEQGYMQAVYPRWEVSTSMTQEEIFEAKRLASKHIERCVVEKEK